MKIEIKVRGETTPSLYEPVVLNYEFEVSGLPLSEAVGILMAAVSRIASGDAARQVRAAASSPLGQQARGLVRP